MGCGSSRAAQIIVAAVPKDHVPEKQGTICSSNSHPVSLGVSNPSTSPQEASVREFSAENIVDASISSEASVTNGESKGKVPDPQVSDSILGKVLRPFASPRPAHTTIPANEIVIASSSIRP
jgi:hypothetical protein